MSDSPLKWIGDYDNYFLSDENGKCIPSKHLTIYRNHFQSTFLKDPNFKKPTSIFTYAQFFDANILNKEHQYHRENDTFSPNKDLGSKSLYHYKIIYNNMFHKFQYVSSIVYESSDYILDGLSLFSTVKLDKIPSCFIENKRVDKYSPYLSLKPISLPCLFSIDDIKLIHLYLLVTLNGLPKSFIFPYLFLFPMYINDQINANLDGFSTLSILSPCEVLIGLLKSFKKITTIENVMEYELLYNSTMNPSVLRVDWIDIENNQFIHKTRKDKKLNCLKNPENNVYWQNRYSQTKSMKQSNHNTFSSIETCIFRNVNLGIDNFFSTGLYPDISFYLSFYSLLSHHIRFHLSLKFLEEYLELSFKENLLYECCLTHSTYDRSSSHLFVHPKINLKLMSNICIPEYQIADIFSCGQRTPKRSKLEIKSTFIHEENYERFEFLGDALIEFITTVSLFHLFPDLTEGSLSIFRSAIIQNCHLSYLANKIKLLDFVLIDPTNILLKNPSELKKVSADAFEALFCAIFFDYDLFECQKCLSRLLWPNSSVLQDLWINLPEYPVISWSKLNSTNFSGDPIFRKLSIFEKSIGYNFSNKHLLAKAFADPSINFNSITCGSNRTLEFLGDAIIQFYVSKHLFLTIHQIECILTDLRSKIVSNSNLLRIAQELCLDNYIITDTPNISTSRGILSDVFESIVAAIFLDGGFTIVENFCNIVFFNSEKLYSISPVDFKLKMICHLICPLRRIKYRILKKEGPTNNILQSIGVYFGTHLLGIGIGHTRKFAKSQAIDNALILLNKMLTIK